MTSLASQTINPDEIAKFEAMAEEWWDPEGKFKPLHIFNPVRIAYIRDQVCKHFGRDVTAGAFEGLSLLDIGCGGGLLSEPMTRMGAEVTAIDASDKNITIAALHAEKQSLTIDYQCTSVENLAETGKQFDVVLNMEVVEHVDDVDMFLATSAQLLKPGGIMFVATINRTLKSYALAIIGAEYILRWLPKGTHDWKKFLKPSEIEGVLSKHGARLQELQGVWYNPLQHSWFLADNLDVNYILTATK